jgi:hypothetical protein
MKRDHITGFRRGPGVVMASGECGADAKDCGGLASREHRTELPTRAMKYRLIERTWETNDRRRYAVERLAAVTDGGEHWSLERFFANVLEAQLYLASLKKGPRVISEHSAR